MGIVVDMKQLTLKVLEGHYTIHRFSPQSGIPVEVLDSSLLSITKTEDELSIVCDASIAVSSDTQECDWSCLKVLGTLDFALTGILATLSSALAEAAISIFAISTYETDYILIKTEKLELAVSTLDEKGYDVLLF